MSAPEVFVAGLHLRWDGVWQRPHHLLTRLARKLPVIVIEEPHGAADDRDDVRRAGDHGDPPAAHAGLGRAAA